MQLSSTIARRAVQVLLATFVFIVVVPAAVAQAPGAFSKTSPANGATGVLSNPAVLLSWASSSNATSYEYCVTSPGWPCFSYTSVGSALSVDDSVLGPSRPFSWQVRAVNASGTTYANGGTLWTFTTMANPGPFSKTSPSDFASQPSTSPTTLSWGSSSNATSYEYCIDTTHDSACTNWVGTGTPSVSLSVATCTGYSWQIRALNANGTTYADSPDGSGTLSLFWRFYTICPPGSFGKTSPANGSSGVSTSQTLSWGSASGATSYDYCYDTTNDNACSGWSGNGTSTTRTVTGLSGGTTYYWHVRANGGGATTHADGGATAFWVFTTGPGPFNKVSPANRTTGVGTGAALSWGVAAAATSYEYCLDTSGDATCGPWVDVGPATSVAISGLSLNTPYSWHVRATGTTGTTYSNASATAFFVFMTGNTGLTGAVQALAVDPSNAQTVYAGTTAGVYRSTDGGANWFRIDSGLTYTNVRALAIRPEAPCTIVAGIDTNVNNRGGYPFYFITNSYGVLAVSTDCGASWGIPAAAPSGRRTESLAFSSASPSVLYAAVVVNDATCSVTCIDSQHTSVVRTTLGGATTQNFYMTGLGRNSVATDPASPCTGYFGSSDLPYRSGTVYQNTSCSDGTWTTVGAPLNGAVTAIAAHPANQATLLAGTSTGSIYRKADGASPWVSVASALGSVNALVYEPGSTSVAYAGTGSGVIYRTTDGGSTWAPLSSIGFGIAALIPPTAVTPGYAGGDTFVLTVTYVPTGPDADGDGIADPADNCLNLSNPTQLDADTDGYGNACDADLNNSGLVTTADFGILRSVLNQAASSSPAAAAADLNGSGTVTTADFAILRARLNTAPGPSGLVP